MTASSFIYPNNIHRNSPWGQHSSYVPPNTRHTFCNDGWQIQAQAAFFSSLVLVNLLCTLHQWPSLTSPVQAALVKGPFDLSSASSLKLTGLLVRGSAGIEIGLSVASPCCLLPEQISSKP